MAARGKSELSSSIAGLGLDLVEVARVGALLERHEERFLRRVCRPGEAKKGTSAEAWAQHVAGLFAAKEAVLKALGTGWGEGVTFRDVEVHRAPSGAPSVRLHGEAHRKAEALGARRVHISITHERYHAAAVAILEK